MKKGASQFDMRESIWIVMCLVLAFCVGCGDDGTNGITARTNEDTSVKDGTEDDGGADTGTAVVSEFEKAIRAGEGSDQLKDFLVGAKNVADVACPCDTVKAHCEGDAGRYININADTQTCLSDLEKKYPSESKTVFECTNGHLTNFQQMCTTCDGILSCLVSSEAINLPTCVRDGSLTDEIRAEFELCFPAPADN